MKASDWHGVMPAITTPFRKDLSVDVEFLREHVAWLVGTGCRAIVTPGSLGEGATLEHDEKVTIWRECAAAVGANVPVIAAVSSLSTADAVRVAKQAEQAGCRGLMVLPPYVYKGEWRETKAHFGAVLRATKLSCMLYNNPVAYGTDVFPPQVMELAAEHENLHAIKESSTDVRRITWLKAIGGDRLALFVGVDDLIVEGIAAGATGWIAGLVNALPTESVRLFDLAVKGEHAAAAELYAWFLPLLRMDTTYDFVQLIKLVQTEVGKVGSGGAVTRPPRLMPEGARLAEVLAEIRRSLAARPG
ncbi:MAG: dihydrodipicolinate synthase family protein [Phycisphaerales bacterium]